MKREESRNLIVRKGISSSFCLRGSANVSCGPTVLSFAKPATPVLHYDAVDAGMGP